MKETPPGCFPRVIAGKIPVEIRYFTSGITWTADYVSIANEDETKLNETGYVRVTSGSGEVYDNVQTRLVVGKINLVEKISELARRPPPVELVPQPALTAALEAQKIAGKKQAFGDAIELAESPRPKCTGPPRQSSSRASRSFFKRSRAARTSSPIARAINGSPSSSAGATVEPRC
jgi:hypothetical protein